MGARQRNPTAAGRRRDAHESGSHERARVVIAGGGVAALEALIALRELLDGLVGIDLVSPTDQFVYRPLSVAEPFGLAEPRRFDLRAIAADLHAELHVGLVESVDHGRRTASVRGGPSLAYDALLVAVGARPYDWLPGAITFGGPEGVARLRALVGEIDAGGVQRIAFAAPGGLGWTIPLYELALLTAARVGERGLGEVQLTVLTPEPHALEVFGPAASRHVRELCANRGIALRTGVRVVSLEGGRLRLEREEYLEVDRVVVVPELHGEPIAGLPHNRDGFIPVDEHGAVRGLPGVYAAGDSTAYPIKQGGLAAQQGDAAAEAIAAGLGAAVEPRPFRAHLRGQLLTGLTPSYLSFVPGQAGSDEGSVALNPLWWPPSKIAGRYLAPYLSRHVGLGAAEELVDREPLSRGAAARAAAEHQEARMTALAFAESDAASADYRSALTWLETLEQLDGLLAPAYADKRAEWRRLASEGG